jgi:subtilisin family serine protease
MGTDTTGPKGAPARAATLDWKFPFDDTWGTGVVVSPQVSCNEQELIFSNTKVYVVDSGVRSTHMELAGRVETGWVLNGLGGVVCHEAVSLLSG